MFVGLMQGQMVKLLLLSLLNTLHSICCEDHNAGGWLPSKIDPPSDIKLCTAVIEHFDGVSFPSKDVAAEVIRLTDNNMLNNISFYYRC